MPLRIPTLEGARVRLVPLSMAHAEGMFRMWSRPEVCTYAGPAPVTSVWMKLDFPVTCAPASLHAPIIAAFGVAGTPPQQSFVLHYMDATPQVFRDEKPLELLHGSFLDKALQQS